MFGKRFDESGSRGHIAGIEQHGRNLRNARWECELADAELDSNADWTNAEDLLSVLVMVLLCGYCLAIGMWLAECAVGFVERLSQKSEH